MMKFSNLVFAAATMTAAMSLFANAQTPLEAAIADGTPLTSDEISELIVGQTVTARAGENTVLFYYSPENVLTGRMVDGAWIDTGYYGIADDNRVCLSMTPDAGRLRCMTLVAIDGVVQKFNAIGELTFELLAFEDGDQL